MVTRLPDRGVIAVATVFVLASIGLTLFVWRSVGGTTPLQAKRYEIHVPFADGVRPGMNTDVRIAGVNVGAVVATKPAGLRTIATLAIDAQYAPLPADVRAIVRQKTLLGETFVALTPGSTRAARLRDGATLPDAQVEATQPLDRVLGMLDAPTRRRLQRLLTAGGEVLDGRSADLNAAYGNIAMASTRFASLIGMLDRQRLTVGRLVRNAGAVLDAAGDEQQAIGDLVRDGHRALSATAGRSRALTATVRAAPAFLAELRATSAAVEHTVAVAAPALHALRPVAPLVAPALREVTRTSAQLDPLLRDLGRLAPTVRRALPAASAMIDALGPLMDVLEPTARQVVPVIDYVAAYRREIVTMMANMGASTNGAAPGPDGRPVAYMRVLTPLTPELVLAADERLPSSRHNAYTAPGGLGGLKDGLEASSCAGAQTLPGVAAPCKVQSGWSFAGGPARYYQHLAERRPDTAAARTRSTPATRLARPALRRALARLPARLAGALRFGRA